MKIIKGSLYATLFAIFFLFISFVLGLSFFLIHSYHIDFSVLEQTDAAKPTIVLDDQGNEWTRFCLDRREPVSLHIIPHHVVNAFIAAEDHNFFKHPGLSLRGIVRSILVNIGRGKRAQGASTITQQLVRLLFLDSNRTFSRKIKEQILALLVERHYSKDQILQTYLNNVYFGAGIYGVQAASQRFWAKEVTTLTIAEGATLAAAVKGARYYSPLYNLGASQKRRNIVLHSMYTLGLITTPEYEVARAEPLILVQESADGLAPHAKESIRQFLEELFGKHALYTEGFTIQTTLNQHAQRSALHQFAQQIKKLREKMLSAVDGALLCIETQTGEIKAFVGGYNFNQSQWNRAEQAKRQIGSIFKPIIYAAAIASGKTFADTAIDEFITIPSGKRLWQPKNYNSKFEGRMTLAHALSRSNNIVTIKTLLDVGVQPIIDLALRCRLPNQMPPYPSLALGCVDVTLKQAVGYFNIFANNGMYVEPHIIRWIKDEHGKKIWTKKVDKQRVLDPKITSQVSQVLTLGIERARTRTPGSWIDCQALGKTGTTNDCRTCWFAGSTPNFTTALYIGCDDNRSLGKNVYAISTALPIWLGLHKQLPIEKKEFSFDSALNKIFIDPKSGARYSAAAQSLIPILVS